MSGPSDEERESTLASRWREKAERHLDGLKLALSSELEAVPGGDRAAGQKPAMPWRLFGLTASLLFFIVLVWTLNGMRAVLRDGMRVLRERLFLALRGLLYAIAFLPAALAVPLATAPLWFAIALWDAPDGRDIGDGHVARALDVIRLFFTGRMETAVRFAANHLPFRCAEDASRWSQEALAHCHRMVDAARFVDLSDFETALHAVFAYCVGLGVILAAGELGRRQLRRFRQDLHKALNDVQIISGYWSTVRNETMVQFVSRTAQRFERFIKWCIRIASFSAYICFLLTAGLAGFLLAVSPWYQKLVVPAAASPEFFAYAAAPFLESIILLVIVIVTSLGRPLFVGWVSGGKRSMTRQARAVQSELSEIISRPAR